MRTRCCTGEIAESRDHYTVALGYCQQAVVHYRSSAAPVVRMVDDITRRRRRAIAVQCDITEPDGCTGLTAAAVEAFGRLDTVVANAGVQPVAELATISVPQWREGVDTNLTGGFATVQAAASVMGDGAVERSS